MKSQFNEQCITTSQMRVIFNLRMYWRRLATWTRIYMISRYLGIGTPEVSFERLYMENQDFGDMLRILFTRSTSDKFSQLMNQFSIGFREFLNAQLEGEYDTARQNLDRLLESADQIAAFLASISPYFDEMEWRNLLRIYLQDTIQEASLFASEDYRMDIAYFDRLMDLSNTIGDAFAQALYAHITSGTGMMDNALPQDGQSCLTYEQMNLIYNIGIFWFDLIHWVRAYMLSRFRNVGNQDEIYERLQQVVNDYINNLRQFFGDAPGVDALQSQLNTYIDLIDALITALAAEDAEEIGRITKLLYENADERAAAISSLNPYWDQKEWSARLNNNLRSTLDETTMFLTENYARNLDIFSTLMAQAESSSDYLAEGLLDYMFQGQPIQ